MPRTLLKIVALLAVFTLVVFLMAAFLPKPLESSDYLVVGSVATLITLGLVFWVFLRHEGTKEGTFFKKRPRR